MKIFIVSHFHLMVTSFFIGILFTFSTVSIAAVVRPSFGTFEDYLQHLDKNLQTSIIRLNDGQQVNASPEGSGIETTGHGQGTATIVGESKYDAASQNSLTNSIGPTVDQGVDEEKNNVTCCILGEMAGDKGFHCFAEFYAARIQLRNINRAHNRKLGFYGRDRLPRYGERLMKTFEQCVAGHGQVFHRCCHLATLERRVMDLRGNFKRKSPFGTRSGSRREDQGVGGTDSGHSSKMDQDDQERDISGSDSTSVQRSSSSTED